MTDKVTERFDKLLKAMLKGDPPKRKEKPPEPKRESD